MSKRAGGRAKKFQRAQAEYARAVRSKAAEKQQQAPAAETATASPEVPGYDRLIAAVKRDIETRNGKA